MHGGLRADRAGSVMSPGGAPAQGLAAVASTVLRGVIEGPHRPARVLGASRVGVYLGIEGTGDEPPVIALLAGRAVRLPVALVVTGFAPEIDVRASISVGEGAVHIGAFRVRATRWFDPRPRLDGPYLASRIDEASRILATLPPGASGVADDPVDAIAIGLAGGDPSPAIAVIGRGSGLTPASDDAVAGALAAMALRGALHREAAGALLAHAVSATTSLSSSLLRCAAAGQVVPQAARFLAALCGSEPLAPSLDDLIAVGHTSGTALAVGMVAGARAVLFPSVEAVR